MDSSSSWIDVDGPPAPANSMDQDDREAECCPMPIFAPNLQGPAHPIAAALQGPAHSVAAMQQALRNTEAKAELHRVLQAIQCSSDFGVYLCESFRDPRRHYIDDYWHDVSSEAIGIEEMHRLVGKVNNSPLTDETRAKFHQLARVLERLSRRIDRVVLA